MNQYYENGVELAQKMDELMHRSEETGAKALVDEALQVAKTEE